MSINDGLGSRMQGCTNPECLIASTTEFCTVAPNICGYSVWKLLNITLMAPRILRWLLDQMEVRRRVAEGVIELLTSRTTVQETLEVTFSSR